jgi:hypothetical protein
MNATDLGVSQGYESKLRFFSTSAKAPKRSKTRIGTRVTGERGIVPTKGNDEPGRAVEGEERGIELRFHLLEAAECDSCKRNHTWRFHLKVMLY